MEFRVLGPLEVVDDEGRSLPLGGARQRALLAALLLRANEVVPLDTLIDQLWGERPPATGTKALQVAVSHLRKTLGDGVLETRPAGYVLRVEPEQLDLTRFDRLRESAQASLGAGRPEEAATALREALALWRGPALADVADESFARADAERLEELRLLALEERIEADLSHGRHGDLVPELEALIARHPLRERLREHLMLALYRSDRQAEALEVYRETRRLLSDELGIEPGTRLQELERAILRHDPELEPTVASRVAARMVPRGRRRWLVLAAGVAGVAAAAFFLVSDRAGTLSSVAPNTLAVIDPERNAIVDSVAVGDSPGPVAAGAGSVWVLNRNSRTITEVDPRTRAVLSTSGTTPTPNALAVGEWVFVLDGQSERLHLLDPEAKAIHDSFALDRSGQAVPGADIAVWGDEVWATDELPAGVIRVRPDPFGAPIDRIELPGSPSAVAAEAERVWVTLDDGRLVVIDRRKLTIERTLEVGRSASGVALGAGAVWVADGLDGTVYRVRAQSVQLTATIRVGRDPGGVAFGAGSVWVANRGDGTVSRIDPGTNRVVATIRVGHRPQEIVVAGGLVWVSVRSS